MFESEYFPIMTFALAAVMLVAFLFTANETIAPVSKSFEGRICNITCPKICKSYFGREACSEADETNCICVIPKLRLFENIFGFIPTSPTIYSLITYVFIHDGMEHLFFNLVFLFIAGLAIEETLGKKVFLSVFITSANFAIIFDILGRFLIYSRDPAIFNSPFVGASGGIFGLLALASVIKANERIPTILNLLLLITIILNFTGPTIVDGKIVLTHPLISWILEKGSAFGPQTAFMIGSLIFLVVCSILLLMPEFPSIHIALLMFLVSALIVIISGYPTRTSNLGHLGGVIGGFVSLYVFSEKEKH